tara:strand:+ start:720 stop:1991 length:1272 start_codon:yes stop_codon:yes gene_type:complete
MTRYLIFDNSSAGFGTQKEIIINWNNIKYIEPVDATSFKIQLNNGGNLNLTLSTGTPNLVIKAIQYVVKAIANGKELRVSPDSLNAFKLSGITFTAPSSGGPGGSGAANRLAWWSDANTLTSGGSIGTPTAGYLLKGQGAGTVPNWQSDTWGVVKNTTFVTPSYGDVALWYDVNSLGAMESYINAGEDNLVFGGKAVQGTLGTDNTGVGIDALRDSTGNDNTGLGHRVLRSATGDDNVAIGESTGYSLSSGSNNVLVGSGINTPRTGDNCIVIGAGAAPSTNAVSNEITLGDSNITVIRAAVTSITSLSDERDKKDVEDLDIGLDFVKSLKPRKFVWDNRVEKIFKYDDDGNVESEEEFYSANKGKKDFGFIAQEVKLLDNDTLRLIYDENPDKLEMSYGKLVPILVKAIQELKVQLDNKQDK